MNILILQAKYAQKLCFAGRIPVFIIGLGAASASAQQGGASPEMQQAMAAGYKATFTCSALFNSGRSLDNIAANELDGIYPDYRPALATLPNGVVNERAKTVSVAWSETLLPRIAVWRPGLGCSQLPIGGSLEMAGELPRFDEWPGDDPAPDDGLRISPDATGAAVVGTHDALMVAVDKAFDGNSFGEGSRTSGVLVIRDGLIIAEQYDRGIGSELSQRTWSVAKSVSATVIGAAVQQGLMNVEDKADLAAWGSSGDPRRAITVANLMHMGSGLDSGRLGSRTDRLYFGGGRVIDHAVTNVLEAAPGSRFKYSNDDTLLAMRALRERMDDDSAFHRLPYEAVLWKIGARRTVLETDWNGDFLSSSQVWTTARDLARIGQLYLQDGVWNGERILPEGWTEFVSAPAPAQPQGGSWGYGAQFWLVGGVGGLPQDAFMAAGHRGQYMLIVPSENTVIVRRGYDPSGEVRFDITAFCAAVLAALSD